MKKIVLAFLSLCTLFTFVSCGGPVKLIDADSTHLSKVLDISLDKFTEEFNKKLPSQYEPIQFKISEGDGEIDEPDNFYTSETVSPIIAIRTDNTSNIGYISIMPRNNEDELELAEIYWDIILGVLNIKFTNNDLEILESGERLDKESFSAQITALQSYGRNYLIGHVPIKN